MENLVSVIRTFPPEAKPSMLVDLEQHKPIELESACGAVVKLGEALGIDTQINRTLYTRLSPYTDG